MSRKAFSAGFLVSPFLQVAFLTAALPQAAPPMKDPVLDEIFKAEDEGRLADAERLVKAAIHDAETKPMPERRLHLLLGQLASLDSRMGRNADAIAVLGRMIEMDERAPGAAGVILAMDLNNLGHCYSMAGNDTAAGQTYERELAVAREAGSPKGLVVAIWDVSEYDITAHRVVVAQALLTEAVKICDSYPSLRFPDCSRYRIRLADLESKQGHPQAIETLASKGSAETAGTNPNWYAHVRYLNARAQQYEQSHSYLLAETAYRQAIDVIEKNSRPQDKAGAIGFQFVLLGQLFEKERRNADAEDAYKRALDLGESAMGPEYPGGGGDLIGFTVPLEGLYRKEGRLADAEPILQHALALQEQVLGPKRIELADTAIELASVYEDERKYSDAEPLYQRAIAIQEENNGPDDAHLIGTLDRYAHLLLQLGQPDKAQAVADRSAALSQKLRQQTPTTPAAN